jgi:hypothetical protein
MVSRFRTEFQGCALACRENEHLAVNVQIGRWLRNLGRHTVEHFGILRIAACWGVAGLPPDHQSVDIWLEPDGAALHRHLATKECFALD